MVPGAYYQGTGTASRQQPTRITSPSYSYSGRVTEVTTPTIGYSNCRCTWTVCQCFQQNMWFSNNQPTIWYRIETIPEDWPKIEKRMRQDALIAAQKRHRPPKIKLPRPQHRPQMQALSMRIR